MIWRFIAIAAVTIFVLWCCSGCAGTKWTADLAPDFKSGNPVIPQAKIGFSGSF